MTLTLKNYNLNFSTNDDGQVIFDIIFPILLQGKKATVDFKGIGGTPTSFINTAFVQLLDHFSFDYIKNHLSLVNVIKVNAAIIKDRMNFHNNLLLSQKG